MSEESIRAAVQRGAEDDVNILDRLPSQDEVERLTRQAYNDILREHRKNLEQNREERQKYAGRIYWMIVLWLVGLYVVLLLQGFTAWGFHLHRWVVITALGGTTSTVFGILWVVTDHLFPGDNNRSLPDRYDSASYGRGD